MPNLLAKDYIQKIVAKAKLLLLKKYFEAIRKSFVNNEDEITKFIIDKWTLKDFEQTEWTRHTYSNSFYLGKEKNQAGDCINCNGVQIYANGWLNIGAFNPCGYSTKPKILIDEYRFDIWE